MRIIALRKMPEFTPLDEVLDAEQQKVEQHRETQAIDAALAPFPMRG